MGRAVSKNGTDLSNFDFGKKMIYWPLQTKNSECLVKCDGVVGEQKQESVVLTSAHRD